ncbi:cleft lip and palate transmembrane protein 1 homolog isoform X1 [Harmonia axyridis]|uniref:cleft lip and palate transmembrane protein 1 homolog isoform X1 n=1 Tax=Harmonia axyridis TaxID=115357 RepID=UPI001E27660C|nr:cleft lip and palate transmembrane protein 1 homolog isoform X1 [Harmonia axyridis]
MSETEDGTTVQSEQSSVSNNEVSLSNGTVENQTQNANGDQPRQQTRMELFASRIKSFLIRGMIVYFIASMFRKPTTPTGVEKSTISASNIYPFGTALTLHIYLDEKDVFTNFSSEKLLWYKEGIEYGDWNGGPSGDGSFTIEKNIPITNHLKNNGSLYIHAYVTKMGENPNPRAANYAKNNLLYMKKQLNRYKKLKNPGTKNLLTGESGASVADSGKIVSHWHPNFTVNLITDQSAWTYGAVPSPLDTLIEFTEDKKNYKPVLFANDFWNMARDYVPINETLTVRVIYQPLSLFKWQMYVAQSMRQSWNLWGETADETSDEEQDTLKETLMDTNPYLLGITIAVSILHSIFELLAFKNDIQFWNKRDSLEGLSVRSVFFNVFQSLIVLLYVMDNETNSLVRISCFVGLGIELWKVYKVVDVKFEDGRLSLKNKSSYVESSTKEYDDLAFKYLSWICFPLLVGYSIYALLYLEHKGWYSFVLNLLYGFLLTFGFIMMTPQLFINYKLKSVAHLPWRMLTYKFLNTFIDDMFAFVIKMPTMYRLGCFRDDIIFLIFLYQKWIYPVDKRRKNEFGFSAEPENNTENLAIEDNKEKHDESKDETKKTK